MISEEEKKLRHREACRRYQLKKFGPRKTIDRTYERKLILEGKCKAKQCSKCHNVKPLSEFGNNKANLDGLEYRCNECRKEYRQRPESKRLSNDRNKRYLQTDKGKACKRRYNHSDTAKVAHKRQAKRAKARYPLKFKARAAVGNAVISNKIPHPTTLQCVTCSMQASEYHHHRGYDKKHWLDVIPVCFHCHRYVFH